MTFDCQFRDEMGLTHFWWKMGLPLAPGKAERREFEYVRHGTHSFIVSRDVVTGQIVAPTCGPSRTEADFLTHLQDVLATSLRQHDGMGL